MELLWVAIGVVYIIWQLCKEEPQYAGAIIGWICILVCMGVFALRAESDEGITSYVVVSALSILFCLYPLFMVHNIDKKKKRKDEIMGWLENHPPTNQELAAFRATYELDKLPSGKSIFRPAEEWLKLFEHNPNSLERSLALRKWKEARASEILSERRKARWKL